MTRHLRQGDDSWDPATGVGATATMVAAARAAETARLDALIRDPFAEELVRAVGLPHFLEQVQPADPPSERRDGNIFAVRTRFNDDVLLDAVDGGLRQVVIPASGLDTRAYRLPWPTGTTVFEIDLAAVLAFKESTLARLGARPASAHRLVPADLRGDWTTPLQAAGFRRELPTVWCVEGLLMYLPPHSQDTLFDVITDLSTPGSRLCTEYVPDLGAFATAQSSRTTPSAINVADLVYPGERNEAAGYLANLGWRVSRQTIAELFAKYRQSYPESEITALFADIVHIDARLPR